MSSGMIEDRVETVVDEIGRDVSFNPLSDGFAHEVLPFVYTTQPNPFLGKDICITNTTNHVDAYTNLEQCFVSQVNQASSESAPSGRVRIADRVDIGLSVLVNYVNYVKAEHAEHDDNVIRDVVGNLMDQMFASGVGMLKITYDYSHTMNKKDRSFAVEVVGEVIGKSAQLNGDDRQVELDDDGGSIFTLDVFDALLHGLKVTRKEVESHLGKYRGVNGPIFAHEYEDVPEEKKTFWDYIFGWMKSKKNKRARKADIENTITLKHAPGESGGDVDKLMLDPTNAAALFNLGYQYFEDKNYLAAAGAFKGYYSNYEAAGEIGTAPIPKQFLQASYYMLPEYDTTDALQSAASDLVEWCNKAISDVRLGESDEVTPFNFTAYLIKASTLLLLRDENYLVVYDGIIEYVKERADCATSEELAVVKEFAEVCLEREHTDRYASVVDLLRDEGEEFDLKLQMYLQLVEATNPDDDFNAFAKYVFEAFRCFELLDYLEPEQMAAYANLCVRVANSGKSAEDFAGALTDDYLDACPDWRFAESWREPDEYYLKDPFSRVAAAELYKNLGDDCVVDGEVNDAERMVRFYRLALEQAALFELEQPDEDQVFDNKDMLDMYKTVLLSLLDRSDISLDEILPYAKGYDKYFIDDNLALKEEYANLCARVGALADSDATQYFHKKAALGYQALGYHYSVKGSDAYDRGKMVYFYRKALEQAGDAAGAETIFNAMQLCKIYLETGRFLWGEEDSPESFDYLLCAAELDGAGEDGVAARMSAKQFFDLEVSNFKLNGGKDFRLALDDINRLYRLLPGSEQDKETIDNYFYAASILDLPDDQLDRDVRLRRAGLVMLLESGTGWSIQDSIAYLRDGIAISSDLYKTLDFYLKAIEIAGDSSELALKLRMELADWYLKNSVFAQERVVVALQRHEGFNESPEMLAKAFYVCLKDAKHSRASDKDKTAAFDSGVKACDYFLNADNYTAALVIAEECSHQLFGNRRDLEFYKMLLTLSTRVDDSAKQFRYALQCARLSDNEMAKNLYYKKAYELIDKESATYTSPEEIEVVRYMAGVNFEEGRIAKAEYTQELLKCARSYEELKDIDGALETYRYAHENELISNVKYLEKLLECAKSYESLEQKSGALSTYERAYEFLHSRPVLMTTDSLLDACATSRHELSCPESISLILQVYFGLFRSHQKLSILTISKILPSGIRYTQHSHKSEHFFKVPARLYLDELGSLLDSYYDDADYRIDAGIKRIVEAELDGFLSYAYDYFAKIGDAYKKFFDEKKSLETQIIKLGKERDDVGSKGGGLYRYSSDSDREERAERINSELMALRSTLISLTPRAPLSNDRDFVKFLFFLRSILKSKRELKEPFEELAHLVISEIHPYCNASELEKAGGAVGDYSASYRDRSFNVESVDLSLAIAIDFLIGDGSYYSDVRHTYELGKKHSWSSQIETRDVVFSFVHNFLRYFAAIKKTAASKSKTREFGPFFLEQVVERALEFAKLEDRVCISDESQVEKLRARSQRMHFNRGVRSALSSDTGHADIALVLVRHYPEYLRLKDNRGYTDVISELRKLSASVRYSFDDDSNFDMINMLDLAVSICSLKDSDRTLIAEQAKIFVAKLKSFVAFDFEAGSIRPYAALPACIDAVMARLEVLPEQPAANVTVTSAAIIDRGWVAGQSSPRRNSRRDACKGYIDKLRSLKEEVSKKFFDLEQAFEKQGGPQGKPSKEGIFGDGSSLWGSEEESCSWSDSDMYL
ncbi:MAG: hypothetical protein JXR42_03775 [Gammaproteobacteria bacterium]|nr:hypothetical protein [Gammaproteobacteria bacterium]